MPACFMVANRMLKTWYCGPEPSSTEFASQDKMIQTTDHKVEDSNCSWRRRSHLLKKTIKNCFISEPKKNGSSNIKHNWEAIFTLDTRLESFQKEQNSKQQKITIDINGMESCYLNPLMECEKNTNWSQNNIQNWRFFYLLFILQNFFFKTTSFCND